jgi:GNAT superfamily N-acetyltransferase
MQPDRTNISPSFRTAVREDVAEMVNMLADDVLGSTRESASEPLDESYYAAFSAIESDTNNEIVIAEYGGELAGFLQITYIPYLTYKGGWRALVEGVRVRRAYRQQGIGKALVNIAIDRSRTRGCHIVQLTTDKKRPDAIEFYEHLGFRPTHEGMKLHLG